tara:strand:- start:526 stop:939 length:414 start_codon:yes stop_codon:yes gene_type:complete
MHRSLNLSTDDPDSLLSNIENTNINNINEIVNFSVDTINCQILEYIIPQHLDQVLNAIFSKIRKEGILTLKFKNFKEISKQYWNYRISDTEYLQYIHNTQSIISIDKIVSCLDPTLQITNIEYANYNILMVIQRVEN